MRLVCAGYPGVGVDVEAPESDCRWLARFLAPAFAPDGAGLEPRLHTIRLVDAPVPPGVDAAGEHTVFALDRGPLRLPGILAGDARVYADGELGVAYAVHEQGRLIEIHRGTSKGLTRIASMRVVRELAHNAMTDSGTAVFHAASFAGPRGAVLISGPKRTGKTTLLGRVLEREGLTYLANDRVAVVPGPSHNVLAIPTIVAVRSGTRQLLPVLGDRLRPLGPFTTLGEFDHPAPDRHSDTWHFAPSQLADAIGCGMVPAAPLAAFVALDPDAPPGRGLRLVDPGGAAETLMASLLGARAGVYHSDVFRSAPPSPDIAQRLARTCDRLAADVACFTLPAPASLDAAAIDELSSLCL